MRYYFLSVFLLAFFSCKKNREEKPTCRLTSVNRAGGNLPVTYRGDTLAVWGEGAYGSSMYFTPAGRLQRIEEPVTNPYILTELLYNTSGLVKERKVYFKEANNWVYKARFVFTYTNNKMTKVLEESDFGNPSTYTYNIVWDGENVKSVITPGDAGRLCTQQFSYDLTKTNPMLRYGYLYFSDGDASYAGYKLPYYFSKNLLANAKSDCPVSGTSIFTYTFNSTGLVETLMDNGNLKWGYEYSCP